MHQGKIECAMLLIDDAIRQLRQINDAVATLEKAIETIRAAKRYRDDPAQTMSTEQAREPK